MKYGYARVSTDDWNPFLQLAALKKAGCKTIFSEARRWIYLHTSKIKLLSKMNAI